MDVPDFGRFQRGPGDRWHGKHACHLRYFGHDSLGDVSAALRAGLDGGSSAGRLQDAHAVRRSMGVTVDGGCTCRLVLAPPWHVAWHAWCVCVWHGWSMYWMGGACVAYAPRHARRPRASVSCNGLVIPTLLLPCLGLVACQRASPLQILLTFPACSPLTPSILVRSSPASRLPPSTATFYACCSSMALEGLPTSEEHEEQGQEGCGPNAKAVMNQVRHGIAFAMAIPSSILMNLLWR